MNTKCLADVADETIEEVDTTYEMFAASLLSYFLAGLSVAKGSSIELYLMPRVPPISLIQFIETPPSSDLGWSYITGPSIESNYYLFLLL